MAIVLKQRHSAACPDRAKGENTTRCRGKCPYWIKGTDEFGTVRESLKTRDYERAMRKYQDFLSTRYGNPRRAAERKPLAEAVQSYMDQKPGTSSETKRKYRRILGFMLSFVAGEGAEFVADVNLEILDRYRLFRGVEGWTWVKEVDVIRAFFSFCVDREWCSKNPAKGLVVDMPTEANEVVPYTREEMACIIRACDEIGRTSYERLRARAMVLLMRFSGLRLSDIVTLSRDHIQGEHLVKKAVKNGKVIRVVLPGVVLAALDNVPLPKGAPRDSKLFFASGAASVRSLVKGAWRTLSAVFERSGVERAHPHRFRHTLATELVGKGESIETVANILGDTPAIVRRHYAKWSPDYQTGLDDAIRKTWDGSTKISTSPYFVCKC